jgi:hypothetical protein
MFVLKHCRIFLGRMINSTAIANPPPKICRMQDNDLLLLPGQSLTRFPADNGYKNCLIFQDTSSTITHKIKKKVLFMYLSHSNLKFKQYLPRTLTGFF